MDFKKCYKDQHCIDRCHVSLQPSWLYYALRWDCVGKSRVKFLNAIDLSPSTGQTIIKKLQETGLSAAETEAAGTEWKQTEYDTTYMYTVVRQVVLPQCCWGRA